MVKIQDAKNRHFGTIAQLCRAVSSQLRHVSTIGKNLLSNSISPTCPHNMVNFGPLAAEICWRVWGIPANFNGFHVLAALLCGIIIVGVSQTLRRWTESATYIQQGGHHVGHWPTFLVLPALDFVTFWPIFLCLQFIAEATLITSVICVFCCYLFSRFSAGNVLYTSLERETEKCKSRSSHLVV